MKLKQILTRCFFSVPWYDLKENYLPLFLDYGIQPEIGLEGNCLYDESPDEFTRVASLLRKAKLDCTLHAPFSDLAAGALDPHILDTSRRKLKKAFALLPVFQPRSMVCHLQYEENKHAYLYEKWFSALLETWRELVAIAERSNVPVMFENTYETTAKTHHHFFSELNGNTAATADHYPAQFCLDVGHLMAFAKTGWQQWLPTLLPWLGQLHLHDNDGSKDAHLAPGQGNFHFMELFEYLQAKKHRPLITFEPHSEKELWATLVFLLDTSILDCL